jgi:FAD/FMN-containing dehydrogenase
VEPTPPLPPAARAALAELVGEQHVLTDRDQRASYEVDWTGRFVGSAPAVVRPGSVDQVAAVLDWCSQEGVVIVPQGGNTGLVGGSVPLAGELVVNLGRLRTTSVDPDAGQVTVGAGCTIADVQSLARSTGLDYGVDLAARDSATVGGTVATNAGGLKVMRYGGTRQQLVGIEAVLADGRVVRHLGGLLKDNTGYDLPGLLCGSEGTLALVTAARLRLVPRHPHRVVALVATPSVDDAVAAVGRWRRRLDALDAAELFLAAGLELVCRVTGQSPPFTEPHAAYVLVEATASTDPTDALSACLVGDPAVADVAVATDERRAAALWSYREEHTTAINTLGPPHKLDVTLPAAELAHFIDHVPEVVAAVSPTARTWLFGHVGDGNVHVNITGVDVAADADPAADPDGAVLELVASLGGSISAEHGIGTAKKAWLHLNRSPAEIAVFRAVKHAFDPQGILHPNCLLPAID